jgi:hypothetical protein
MSAKLHVTLSEVVQVASPPLKEPALWVLLHLASNAVQAAAHVGGAAGRELLITPESLLLYPGGRLEVLPGVHDSAKSQFRAPEMSPHGEQNVEKMHVYALGATVRAALACSGVQKAGTTPLHQLLAAMTATDPAQRPSLHCVLSTCARHTLQGAAEEVDCLVALILGTDHDVSILCKPSSLYANTK